MIVGISGLKGWMGIGELCGLLFVVGFCVGVLGGLMVVERSIVRVFSVNLMCRYLIYVELLMFVRVMGWFEMFILVFGYCGLWWFMVW